ncbi:MAG: chromate transporter [Lachnospiraceae bacterium]|nr:chromate transporter [Lachnospiraceae bacterium]
MIYLQLFLGFLQVGLFSFGGGYAALPLIQAQVIDAHGWLSMKEFTDLITLSQMTPGPIAINAATFVGIKVAGLPGAFSATLGNILPSCIIVTLIAKLYIKYQKMDMLQGVLKSLRPAVVALIASAGIVILKSTFWKAGITFAISGMNVWLIFIFIIGLTLLLWKKLNPIVVMVFAGLLNVVYHLIK